MNKIKILSLLFLIILLNSCANLNDDWIDLGNDYVCKIDADTKSIYSRQSYYKTEIHSKIIDYKFDSKFIIAKQNPDYEYYKNFVASDYSIRFAIYEDYLKNSKTEQFRKETTPFIRKSIIADSLHYKLLKSKGVTSKNQTEDMEKIKIILDSVFKFDPFYMKVFSSNENYWIIDKVKNLRFGPFSKNEFKKELIKKNVNLKFE